MEIIHISAECYPVAKAGGLADVVGALPKYQCKTGHHAKVIMPMYETKFLLQHEFDVHAKGSIYLGPTHFDYTIIKEKNNTLGFDLFLVDIKGLLDRTMIYSHADDIERFVAFQIAVLDWINSWEHVPDIIHCHDHHSALIPFMMQHCYGFKNKLAKIPSVLTIHNAQYQGWIGLDKSFYIPTYDNWKTGLLEWEGNINSLASGIKCAWKVTTVSESYMNELKWNSNGLEKLFEYEKGKCIGILNGIDNEVWNPQTDSFLKHHFSSRTVTNGKKKNKQVLCNQFGLDPSKPLIVFIGRLVGEKAADVLPDSIMSCLYTMKDACSFLILGSGESQIEWQLQQMNHQFGNNYHAVIGYNEALSHNMYAGADFLLMPSRVEPCGLNQLYALRYGTIPIVRSTGGLQDTVKDMGENEGFGIRFNNATVRDIYYSVERAIEVYQNPKQISWMRKYMMAIDHSWESVINNYANVYQQII